MALKKYWVAQCVWIKLCATVAVVITINNFWKLFCCGFNRYHYDILIGIRELLERLSLDCIKNNFTTDAGNLAKNIPQIYEVDDGETVSNFCALHFSSSDSHSTEEITIYGLTLNSASFSASTLVDSTIGSQCTSEKEVSKYGERYNSTTRGYCNGRLNNGKICLKRTL